MADSPQLRQVEQLYLSHAEALFGLCYLHAAGPTAANALLHTLLCDLLVSPRCWRLASSGTAGLFRCAQNVCMDQYLKRPRRKRKKPQKNGQEHPSLPRASLPFTMTDSLRAILRLPAKYKAPLYLRLALGWNAQDTAIVAGCSPKRVEKRIAAGLKKTKLTEDTARKILTAIAPTEYGPQEIWDGLLVDREDRNFAGKHRLRRFRRWLDNAIPYVALGTIALCILAYSAVEYGWLSGQAYIPTPLDGYVSQAEDPDVPTGTLTVFVPEGDSFIQYNVTDAPLSLSTLVRQMVALGGAPEGTFLLSSRQEEGELTLELSREAAQAGQDMLSAMAATCAAAYPDLQGLRILCDGKEINVWDYFPKELEPVRTVTTPYHE